MRIAEKVWLAALVALVAACGAFAADAKPGDAVAGLQVALAARKTEFYCSQDVSFVATYKNVGDHALSLPVNWWQTRSLIITDADGKVLPPGKGPMRPCGIAEGPTVIPPGDEHSENAGLESTQPAGNPQQIGYNYSLKPGEYKVVLVHQAGAPPAEKNDFWGGKVLSNEVAFTIKPPTNVTDAIKAEWPTAALGPVDPIPVRPHVAAPKDLWRATLDIKSGEKTQTLTVAVSATGVVTRVSTPIEPADLPKVVSDAVAAAEPSMTISKAGKLETRVDVALTKLPKPQINYSVYVTSEKKKVWLYVGEDGAVSWTLPAYPTKGGQE